MLYIVPIYYLMKEGEKLQYWAAFQLLQHLYKVQVTEESEIPFKLVMSH